MIDYNYYQKILKENGQNFSIEEVKLITDLLKLFAEINLEIFENSNKYHNEESSSNGEGQLG